MGLYDAPSFLESATFAKIKHEQRKANRFIAIITGIEPRQKSSMRLSEKVTLQKKLLKHLKRSRKKAFAGPIVLKLILHTTDKNPTLSHNIAKNLLDLFARPLKELNSRRKFLLYKDDDQVQGLSVICSHGNDEPTIIIEARPIRDFLSELAIVRELPADSRADGKGVGEVLGEFADVEAKEERYRETFGDQVFESLRRYTQQRAQRALLGEAALDINDLADLYSVGARAYRDPEFETAITRIFSANPLRVSLNELPSKAGARDTYLSEMEEKLQHFLAKFGKLVDPILVPVALEVVIKPGAKTSPDAKHDLDNVVRRYVLPRVMAIIKPISHPRFLIDMESIRKHAPELSDRMGTPPPASTKIGVTRYEVWRLPAAQPGDKGFVTVAVLADEALGYNDVLRTLEVTMDKWTSSLKDDY